jgi:sulfopyruvate decarboxylase TPP-binding subunit
MSPTDRLYSSQRSSGLGFFPAVRCELLNGFIQKLDAFADIICTPVSREGDDVE